MRLAFLVLGTVRGAIFWGYVGSTVESIEHMLGTNSREIEVEQIREQARLGRKWEFPKYFLTAVILVLPQRYIKVIWETCTRTLIQFEIFLSVGLELLIEMGTGWNSIKIQFCVLIEDEPLTSNWTEIVTSRLVTSSWERVNTTCLTRFEKNDQTISRPTKRRPLPLRFFEDFHADSQIVRF